MMNSVSLLGAGLIVALLSWIFWHYFGGDTPCAIVTIALVGVTADNARLRRQLREKT
jgi:hypothetical protein